MEKSDATSPGSGFALHQNEISRLITHVIADEDRKILEVLRKRCTDATGIDEIKETSLLPSTTPRPTSNALLRTRLAQALGWN
jgi:hypothetical protein